MFCECASLDICFSADSFSAIDVKSEIGIFSEHDFPAFGKHSSRRDSVRAASVGIGGAIAEQQQASKEISVNRGCKETDVSEGGSGALEQR